MSTRSRTLLAALGVAVLLAPSVASAHGPMVKIASRGVEPARLVISVGQTVHFQNANAGMETCTIVAENGEFAGPSLGHGEGWHHTFADAGSFPFFIEEFSSARGEIVVLER